MSEKNDAGSPTPSNEAAPAAVDWLEAETLAPVPGEQPKPAPAPDNAAVEGDDTPEPKSDDPLADDDEIEAEAGDAEDGPPEFWSAERKAEWEKLKEFPELRAAVKGHYEEATRGLNKKLEEAAAARKTAEESAQKVLQNDEQNVAWWNANGEAFQKTFGNRWAGVDWVAFAAKDPAAAQEARFQMEKEATQLHAVAQQAEAARQRVENQHKDTEQKLRAGEHEKLATKYPKAFGKPEIAQKTYDTLSEFLAQKGVPKEQISRVYEAPVVEIIMEAYKYSQLRAKAKEVTTPKPGSQPASKTPTRVVPGATTKVANQPDEATRQAEERLRSGERLSPEEASLAFR